MDDLWLVTGCGNSGTGWAARLFQALGYRCGHERWHNQDPYRGMQFADSAWPAVANLDRVPAGVPVVWLVRHPLAVLRSAAREGFLADLGSPYAQLIARVAPEVVAPEDPVDRLIRWVATWDQPLAGRPLTLRVRVEDCTPDRPGVAADMVEHCTMRRPAERRLVVLLGRLGRSTNSHAPDRAHLDAELTADAVADRPEGQLLVERAVDLGYEWG